MSKSKAASGFIILLITVVCFAGAFLLWGVIEVPNRVKTIYGSPAPGLTAPSRFSLTMQLYFSPDRLIYPLAPQGARQSFKITAGETARSVALRLEAAGIIADAEAFTTYLVYRGQDTTLLAGLYELTPADSALSIAQQMQDAAPGEASLTIFPGWRIEEVAEAVRVSGIEITPDDFIKAAYQAPYGIPLGQPDPEILSMEGFFFPGTYHLPRASSQDDVFRLVLLNFDQQVTSSLRQAFIDQGLSLYEGVILASIVQREAMLEDEQPRIASVFLNRLRIGMGLFSDPTVQYAIGYDSQDESWWKSPLSAEDLDMDSPYNTYRQTGLPPAPICSPGLAAIKAVAYAEQSDYLYFRASCDNSGRHVFSLTYDEHLQNACP